MLATSYGIASTNDVDFTMTDVQLGSATTFTDNVPEFALGSEIAFDRALPPRGSILAFHKDRLWCVGSDETSRSYPGFDAVSARNCLFYTEFADYAYWPGDNLIEVGDDAPITGLISWGDSLIIFKTNSVWALRGYSDTTAGDMRVDLLSSEVGCVAEGCSGSGPAGVLWQAQDGYYLWAGGAIKRIIETIPGGPWAMPNNDPFSTEFSAPRIAFQGDRFYLQQTGGWMEYEPATERWSWHSADMLDADWFPFGFRAYNLGPYQSHVLTRMPWVSGGDLEITVLDAGPVFGYGDYVGNYVSGYHAPVRLTLAPLEAPPGYLIQPLEAWADLTYDDDATPSLRPKLILTPSASYSTTEGANVWPTTPDAPQVGEVVGIPPSYEYTGTLFKTNAARRWYVQLVGTNAVDFELHSVRLGYVLVRDRGGA